MHDEKLQLLAREVAVTLPEFFAPSGKKNLTEQSHLQKVTDQVLERLISEWGSDFTRSGSKLAPVFKKLGWLRTGGVDVSFQWRDQLPTVIELKCADDLSACAWDAVKLAPAALEGHVHAAYLLAAAPTQMWSKPTPGADLFATDTWESMGSRIRDKHIKWWRKWQTEGHIPGLVAETFETHALGSFTFTINTIPWELRLARIDTLGSKVKVWKRVPPI